MNEYYKNLPRKWMGSGALFFDSDSKVLIVKPTYKDYWEIPGGSVGLDESPWDACVREIKEELGLAISGAKLLSIDYTHDIDEKGDRLMFVYDGGTLDPSQIAQISLQESELNEYRFVTADETVQLLGERLRKRIPNSMRARNDKRTMYLEGGEEVATLK